MKCPVCKVKKQSWMHEISCRGKNALAWLLYDYVIATTETQKQQSVANYFNTTNDAESKHLVDMPC